MERRTLLAALAVKTGQLFQDRIHIRALLELQGHLAQSRVVIQLRAEVLQKLKFSRSRAPQAGYTFGAKPPETYGLCLLHKAPPLDLFLCQPQTLDDILHGGVPRYAGEFQKGGLLRGWPLGAAGRQQKGETRREETYGFP